jgi:Domain of unknown function (DUF4136)
MTASATPTARRSLLGAVLAGTALLFGGCAAMNRLDSEVSTYGNWPAERKAAIYVFERLPSQQAHPERQQQLEDAAAGALQAAGFTPAADAKGAEYLVQLGARVSTDDPWFDNDPLFWRANLRYGYGYGFGRSVGWGRNPWGLGTGLRIGYDHWGSYDREVAVLIRDRRTGDLLYEARATNSGPSASIDRLLQPMYRAALAGFPGIAPNPHTVSVQLAGG